MKEINIEDVCLFEGEYSSAYSHFTKNEKTRKLLLNTWEDYIKNPDVKPDDVRGFNERVLAVKEKSKEMMGHLYKHKIKKGLPEQRVRDLLQVRFSQIESLKKDGLKEKIPLVRKYNHWFLFHGIHRLTMLYALGVKKLLIDDLGFAVPKGFSHGDFFDSPEELEVDVEDLRTPRHPQYTESLINFNKSICVSIDKKGIINVVSGQKKVKCLRRWGNKKVKVKVGSRDKEWLDFKRRVAVNRDIKEVYQPVLHPDFSDWRISQPSKERLDMILEMEGTVKNKNVVDVGCHYGYFSFQLAKRGARVIGVDKGKWYNKMANEIRALYGIPLYNPRFVISDFGEYFKNCEEFYDFGLFMSIFHDTLKELKPWEKLNLLSEKVERMYFDIALDRPLPVDPLKIPHEILKRTKYNEFKFLFMTALNRPFYIFSW